MYVQGVENVYDLDFNGAGVTYGDVFLRAEQEYSAYNFEFADTEMLIRHFADAERECAALVAAGWRCRPMTSASRRAICSTCWMRAGVISVAERAAYIGRVRNLAKACAEIWLAGEAQCLSFFWSFFRRRFRRGCRRGGAGTGADLRRGACRACRPPRCGRFYGPRRIALAAKIAAEKPGGSWKRAGRGIPRRKRRWPAFWANIRPAAKRSWPKAVLLAAAERRAGAGGRPDRRRVLAQALAKFSWPKSMRWGQRAISPGCARCAASSACWMARWCRSTLGPVAAGNETEGHRVHGAGVVRGFVRRGLGGKTARASCDRGSGRAAAG